MLGQLLSYGDLRSPRLAIDPFRQPSGEAGRFGRSQKSAKDDIVHARDRSREFGGLTELPRGAVNQEHASRGRFDLSADFTRCEPQDPAQHGPSRSARILETQETEAPAGGAAEVKQGSHVIDAGRSETLEWQAHGAH